MANRLLTLLMFLFCAALRFMVTAQQSPHFLEKLTTEQGLSSNHITDLVQDDEGFLWIASSEGLNRFDGTEVRQFLHNTQPNSLPHNYVYCLLKLPGNYLAIGTQKGLSFYNGKTGSFHNFYYRKNDGLDEMNNIIVMIRADKQGNIWAASKNCIFVFDAQRNFKTVIISSYTAADVAKERVEFVKNIFPLTNGKTLLNLYTGWKIFSPRDNSVQNAHDYFAGTFPPFNKLLALLSASKKNEPAFPAAHIFQVFDRYFLCVKPGQDSLLLFNQHGLQLSTSTFPFNRYPFILWSQQVEVLDSTSLLFLFHNYGCARIPVTWKNGQPVLNESGPLLFEGFEYIHALKDIQNNWWLATAEAGLQKAAPCRQVFTGHGLIDKNTGKPTKYEVNQHYKDGNKLWTATYGDGFFCTDMITGQQQHFLLDKTDNEWSNFIWNIRQHEPGLFWLGTQGGLFWYNIKKQQQGRISASVEGKPAVLDSVAITTQFSDSRGLIWMGLGRGNGVCYFDKQRQRFQYYPGKTPGEYSLRYPVGIAEDSNADLWFSNDASPYLMHWKRSTQTFSKISLPISGGQESGNLNGICCEGDSVIWIGGVTSGLIQFQRKNNTCRIYGHDEGLANSNITRIFQDDKKRLWLVTQAGLTRFDKETGTFRNYSPRNGLPVNHPTAGFYYDHASGLLYNGGHGAFFYFDPGNIMDEPAPRRTIITGITVNGNPLMIDSNKLQFRSSQNDISIHFAAIDLTNGPETRYAYRLLGEDSSWIDAGSQRQINFSRLSPGHYSFMVRSSNNNAGWNKEYSVLDFYIRPAFTQTIWFYLLLLMLVAVIAYALHRFRVRQLLRTEDIRTEISRNLHDEVGATLTNISLGSLLAQKQLAQNGQAKRLLERIYQDSQDVSEAMREIVWSIDPNIDTVGDAFPRMLRYASEILEAKDIELTVETDLSIEQVKLSMQQRRDLYLIFKEAINNLAKHSQATKALIHFHREEEHIVMLVNDNGIGCNMTESLLTNGLKNMQARAKKYKWHLLSKSTPGQGTSITLKARIT